MNLYELLESLTTEKNVKKKVSRIYKNLISLMKRMSLNINIIARAYLSSFCSIKKLDTSAVGFITN